MSIRETKTIDETRDAQFVAAYLQEHPEFFRQHPEVLEKLSLPHRSGAAVSLVEKQQAVLRERNTELRTRLNALMETSKTNDMLFDKSRGLVLSLIKADSAATIFKVLHRSITQDFRIEHYSLVLLDRKIEGPGVRVIDSLTLPDILPAVKGSSQPLCGALRTEQMALLFGEDGSSVGSAAAIGLATEEIYGILAFGNSDSHHYHSGMDTLFLRFIADVLNLVLHPKL